MATLTGNKIKDSYGSLLAGAFAGLSSTVVRLTDGLGNNSPLYLSNLSLGVGGTVSGQNNSSLLAKAATSDATRYASIFYNAADEEILRLQGDRISIFGGAVHFPAGTQSLPSIAAAGDVNCGLYFPAVDSINIVTDAKSRVQVTANGSVAVRTSDNSNIAWLFDGTSGNGALIQGNASSRLGCSNYFPSSSGGNFAFNITDSTIASPGRFLITPTGTITNVTMPMVDILDSSSVWLAPYMRILKGAVTFFQINNNGDKVINAPTTSAGTFDLLSRDTTSGVIEKVPVAVSAGVLVQSHRVQITIAGTAYYLLATPV